MNPYETDPKKIPPKDIYIREPHFGRYATDPSDYKPKKKLILSCSDAAIAYWKSILELCSQWTRIVENLGEGRDVFAIGTMIIKSGHLNPRHSRDFTSADANEMAGAALAQTVLSELGVRVPEYYFRGKVCASSTITFFGIV
jgi:hypothetical protein